ncbi:Sec-independent protein translocase subunit TatA/TatB [Gynurincola endophyticus]|jgi:sec-independent protein translocase protein TatA|uniref:Sec-independent protein translocase subunit TatA/TatB n=1 Tax=Gynurincola endophyticus TaxID=2479004 RepID=UPI000F8F31A3|nr:twin-arginine translocase TatA/TatE family subunit [Gynurincola endophyticus]
MIFLVTLLFAVGPKELILIVIAILILFGGKKIPELMRGIGRGISEYKHERNKQRKDTDD